MKRSTLVLLATIPIFVAAALFALKGPGEESSGSDIRGPFVTFDSAAVDRITIDGPGTSVELVRRDGEWRMVRPVPGRADQAAPAGFLHDLRDARRKEVVSSRPEKRSIFQVDSTGTTVRLYAGSAEAATIVVGKEAGSYLERYGRSGSSNDVVLVDGLGPGQMNKPLKDWRDRTLLRIPRERIGGVRYQYGDTVVAVSLRDSLWTVNGRPVRSEAVDGLLTALSAFEADDIVPVPPAAPPRVTASLRVGDVDIAFAYEKDRNAYLVRASGSPEWFRLEPWHAAQVLLRARDLERRVK